MRKYVIENLNQKNLHHLTIQCGPQKEPYIKGKKKKVRLLKKLFNKGHRGLIAYNLLGSKRKFPVGMAEFAPLELTPINVEGRDLLFLRCIWIIPKHQKSGLGKKMMEKIIEESKPYEGVAVFGYEGIGFMPKSFFEKFGFVEVDRRGPVVLLFKQNRDSATLPKIIDRRTKVPKSSKKLLLELFCSDFCPYFYPIFEEFKRVGEKLSYKVELKIYDVNPRDNVLRYGMAGAILLDGKPPFLEPPKLQDIEKIVLSKLKG